MQGEQRRTITRLGLLGDADGNAQLAVTDRAPCLVARAAADADDSLQGRCSKVPEPLISQCLDDGNAFQQTLEELRRRRSGVDDHHFAAGFVGLHHAMRFANLVEAEHA